MKAKGPQPNHHIIEYTGGVTPYATILINPFPAPRMTRFSKKTPRVMSYFAFRNELMLKANLINLKLPNVLNVLFVIAMPDSWSKKKKEEMNNQPHRVSNRLSNSRRN